MNHYRPKILAFAGSLRKESVNKKLIRIAAQGAKDAGADVTLIELEDFPMPIYNGDVEDAEGLPKEAQRLKKLMMEHQGFLISAPEYNSSISAALKNAIDWVSRPVPNEEFLIAFKDKIIALMSASPSFMGGLRGLVTVRSIFGNIGSLVLADQLCIPNAYDAFDEHGHLKDPKKEEQAKKIGAALSHATAKFHHESHVLH